jgi:hypothetical protein
MQKRNIIEIVGIISVVGSLIFVGVEIKQNTSAVRGATQQAVSSQVSEMYRIISENERMADIMNRAFKGATKADLSEADYVSFRAFQMMGLRRIENIYLQYKNGLLTEDAQDRRDALFFV